MFLKYTTSVNVKHRLTESVTISTTDTEWYFLIHLLSALDYVGHRSYNKLHTSYYELDFATGVKVLERMD